MIQTSRILQMRLASLPTVATRVAAAVVATAALCASLPIQAQTAWPPYIANLVAAPSESGVTAELPADVTVLAPDSALAPEKGRFSGMWRGWACLFAQCDVQVAVEKLSTSGATVVYAGANATQGRITERGEARFVGDELHMPLRTGATLVLRLRTSGDMELSLWKPATQLLSAGVLTQKAFAYARSVERMPTPFTDANGRAQTLEMVIYRPPGAGPFPTLVFNHGSTGNGDKPEWFTHTWTSPEVGRVFAEQGWQIVFPQRRGRGKSDGLYDEGFEPDRSRYACQASLALPGLERALADLDAVMVHVATRSDVDAQRMLIGGVSRGGILSIAYAGTRATPFLGVSNFVGGWVGDRCPDADNVNPVAFRRGAAFSNPTLWLYGDKDPFYALRHSRKNFDAFIAAGGKGQFIAFDAVPGGNGHYVHAAPVLWQSDVMDYLQQVVPR
jgi:dienelactone hydrolase